MKRGDRYDTADLEEDQREPGSRGRVLRSLFNARYHFNLPDFVLSGLLSQAKVCCSNEDALDSGGGDDRQAQHGLPTLGVFEVRVGLDQRLLRHVETVAHSVLCRNNAW